MNNLQTISELQENQQNAKVFTIFLCKLQGFVATCREIDIYTLQLQSCKLQGSCKEATFFLVNPTFLRK